MIFMHNLETYNYRSIVRQGVDCIKLSFEKNIFLQEMYSTQRCDIQIICCLEEALIC